MLSTSILNNWVYTIREWPSVVVAGSRLAGEESREKVTDFSPLFTVVPLPELQPATRLATASSDNTSAINFFIFFLLFFFL